MLKQLKHVPILLSLIFTYCSGMNRSRESDALNMHQSKANQVREHDFHSDYHTQSEPAQQQVRPAVDLPLYQSIQAQIAHATSGAREQTTSHTDNTIQQVAVIKNDTSHTSRKSFEQLRFGNTQVAYPSRRPLPSYQSPINMINTRSNRSGAQVIAQRRTQALYQTIQKTQIDKANFFNYTNQVQKKVVDTQCKQFAHNIDRQNYQQLMQARAELISKLQQCQLKSDQIMHDNPQLRILQLENSHLFATALQQMEQSVSLTAQQQFYMQALSLKALDTEAKTYQLQLDHCNELIIGHENKIIADTDQRLMALSTHNLTQEVLTPLIQEIKNLEIETNQKASEILALNQQLKAKSQDLDKARGKWFNGSEVKKLQAEYEAIAKV